MNKFLVMCSIFMSLSIFADLPKLTNTKEVEDFFSFSPDSLIEKEKNTTTLFLKKIDDILSIKQPSFADTLRPLDQAIGEFMVVVELLVSLSLVHPDKDIRKVAHEGQNRMEKILFESLYTHPELYTACVSLKDSSETLSDKELFYLSKTIQDLEAMGCHLSEEERSRLVHLQGELAELCSIFEKNIREDQSHIFVSREELEGMDGAFLESLEMNEQGKYKLTCDYPVCFPVLKHCKTSSTRHAMYTLFNNRAYPINESVLAEIIAKRDALGKLLGFSSFAALDLSGQMVKQPEKAQAFLEAMQAGIQDKLVQEIETLKSNLPASVSLTEEGKIQAFDAAFIASKYEEERFFLDERKISEYFPLENTLKSLISIYESFFSLTIEEEKGVFWDDKVKLLSFKQKGESALLGYLLLDLFPRENKYTHACQVSIIPAHNNSTALALVVANFSKATESRPALLTHAQVTTLFHEFGHAIHTILGRGDFVLLCGTNVQRDFVELPSQLLEEWLWNPAILQKISSHYLTKEPLPFETLEQMLKGRNALSALWVARQCYLSSISLNYFSEGDKKDCQAIATKAKEQLTRYIAYDPNEHFYLSFGHLTGYGAKYYGYLWSRVFALDVFDSIAKEGLLNPEVGKRYVENILGKGGSEDPELMLEKFLKRKPSEQAFLKAYGL